jgi:hypothetical protein
MPILNQINLTQDEEDCILYFLRQAENNRSLDNESYQETISSIFLKYWKRHKQIQIQKNFEHWDD